MWDAEGINVTRVTYCLVAKEVIASFQSFKENSLPGELAHLLSAVLAYRACLHGSVAGVVSIEIPKEII